MRYEIEFRPSALKALRQIDRRSQIRIARVIDGLATNQYPAGCKKLAGAEDFWRVRAGDYRIIYTVEQRRLTVLVLKLGHRRDIYQ